MFGSFSYGSGQFGRGPFIITVGGSAPVGHQVTPAGVDVLVEVLAGVDVFSVTLAGLGDITPNCIVGLGDITPSCAAGTTALVAMPAGLDSLVTGWGAGVDVFPDAAAGLDDVQ